MSTSTEDYEPKEPGPDDTELTIGMMNAALIPASRERGWCLCIHPFMTMINFAGCSCKWCSQPVTDEAWTPEAKDIRTEVVKAAYPQFVKQD